MIDALYTGLRAAMAADSTLITELGGTAIFAQHASETTALPYLIMQHMAGGDTNLDAGQPFDAVVSVICCAATGDKAGTVAERVRTVLHENTALNLGTAYESVRCQHTNAVSYVEFEDRKPFYYQGGLYRLRGNKA